MSPKIRSLDSVDSTQLELRRCLKEDPLMSHLSAVLAKNQSQGRGRGDHTWESLPGNLSASLLVRLDEVNVELQKNLTWLPLWVGVQVRGALIHLGLEASSLNLKWPNDLIWNRKEKLGGVLCEKSQNQVFVGIGINLLEVPKNVPQPTTSWKQIAEHPPETRALLEAIQGRLATPFSLEILRVQLLEAMIPKPGDTVLWRDPEPKAGLMKSLGGFGELRVMVETSQGPIETQLFSEEVSIKLTE